MAQFFFHLDECGRRTTDHDGRELPDLDAALKAARTEAREIMCAEVRHGTLCLSCHIEIVHGETGERTILRFGDALTVTGM